MRGALGIKLLATVVFGGLLLGCQLPSDNGAKEAKDTPTGGFELVSQDAEKAACEAEGGDYRQGGYGRRMICFTTPVDAGKSCQTGAECSSNICLARSQSCAPIQPLLGCNEIFDRLGRRVTLCID